MLDDDPSIIEPLPLTKDANKFANNKDLSLIEKAKRRGKFGFAVGRNVEVVPHYRRPHLGIRWTGEGRKIPKIRPIKGAIIHRTNVATMPTGFADSPVTSG